MRYIDSIDVNTRISELLDNLDANIRTIGNDVGWHQHLGARKIGIVASAIGQETWNCICKGRKCDCRFGK